MTPSKKTTVLLAVLYFLAPWAFFLAGGCIILSSGLDHFAFAIGLSIVALGIVAREVVVHYMKKNLPPESHETP